MEVRPRNHVRILICIFFAYSFIAPLFFLLKEWLQENDVLLLAIFHDRLSALEGKRLDSSTTFDKSTTEILPEEEPQLYLELETEEVQIHDVDITHDPEFFFFEEHSLTSPLDKALYRSERFETSGLGTQIGNTTLRIFGDSSLSTSYGYVTYLSQDEAPNDFTQATSRNFRSGFILDPSISFNLKGKVGERVLIDIDFDQREKLLDNKIKLKYVALREKEFVREVTIGNIDVASSESYFSKYDGIKPKEKKTLGIESKFRTGKFNFTLIGSLLRGERETEFFFGKTNNENITLSDYQYISKKFFQLEPFLYYDGYSTPPTITTESYSRGDPNSLLTLTSSPTNSNGIFIYKPVNIDPTSIEVWIDDKNNLNNQENGATAKVINSNIIGFFSLIAVRQRLYT